MQDGWTQEQQDKAYKFIDDQAVANGADPNVDRIEEIRSVVDEAWLKLHGPNPENYRNPIEVAFKRPDGSTFNLLFTCESIEAAALA